MAKSPEVEFRVGTALATVLIDKAIVDGSEKIVRSINITAIDSDRSSGESVFTPNDLPAAIRVLQLAHQHVEAREGEVRFR